MEMQLSKGTRQFCKTPKRSVLVRCGKSTQWIWLVTEVSLILEVWLLTSQWCPSSIEANGLAPQLPIETSYSKQQAKSTLLRLLFLEKL